MVYQIAEDCTSYFKVLQRKLSWAFLQGRLTTEQHLRGRVLEQVNTGTQGVQEVSSRDDKMRRKFTTQSEDDRGKLGRMKGKDKIPMEPRISTKRKIFLRGKIVIKEQEPEMHQHGELPRFLQCHESIPLNAQKKRPAVERVNVNNSCCWQNHQIQKFDKRRK